ncbi:hypothetical protein [Deinococcus apachensis]|uniref:hypothetical protein n=1 Tax=Deinococcus apachensis TaxID=309886 RepID=UPI0012FB410E|nr:hypothetical protein [Deinococcus apachensis]
MWPVEPPANLEIAQHSIPAPADSLRPSYAPTPHVLPTLPTAGEVRGERALSVGAARLWGILHDLALHVARHRGHTAAPVSITFHLPAVILAAVAGYSERHTYRLADELRHAGLLDERGHVAQVGKLRRYDGTLWAVALRPDARPRLRWFDFRHDWRPDFATEYHGEQGAWREVQAVMSEPLTLEGQAERLQGIARTWAAATRTPKTPAEGGSDMCPGATLHAVAYALPGLLHLPPRQRHREVSRLAADLAHALNEPGRLKQWAGTIYTALSAENEQRPGLHVLALQLARLAADLAEGAPWRNPGAVLAARLR